MNESENEISFRDLNDKNKSISFSYDDVFKLILVSYKIKLTLKNILKFLFNKFNNSSVSISLTKKDARELKARYEKIKDKIYVLPDSDSQIEVSDLSSVRINCLCENEHHFLVIHELDNKSLFRLTFFCRYTYHSLLDKIRHIFSKELELECVLVNKVDSLISVLKEIYEHQKTYRKISKK